MSTQLAVTPIDTLTASVPSIDAAVSSVKVSPEMIQACGSERSARFAAVASLLNSKELSSLYTKSVLYARWKADFKSEKNTLYKSLAELAANCGESRQTFGALSKVGQVFFPEDKDAAAIAERWTERRYSPYILFELVNLPYTLLNSIANTLDTFAVDSNGKPGKITSGQARCIKEAYAKCGKDYTTFLDTFMRSTDEEGHEQWYNGDIFIDRICKYKLYLAEDLAADDVSDTSTNTTSEPDTAPTDKSGYSTYLFIAPNKDRLTTIGADGKESEIINTLSDSGYKIIASETNKRGIIRTFINNDNDIRIIGVFPLSVDSLTIDVDNYNESVKKKMEESGAGEYFHPFTVVEYVEVVTRNENMVDFLRI